MSLYYKCKWIVRMTENYYKVVEETRNSEYEISFLSEAIVDSLSIFSFVIKVRDKQGLTQFKQLLQGKLDMTDWIETDRKEFQQGYNFTAFLKQHSKKLVTSVIDAGMYARIAISNERQIDMQSDSNSYYYAFDWLFHPSDIEPFYQLFHENEESKVLFYTLEPKIDFFTCKQITIGIRFSEKLLIHKYKNKINLLHTLNWRSIDQKTFYKGLPIRGLYNINRTVNNWTQYALSNKANECFE